MDYIKDYQKRWHKFIEQVVIHSKHWSKYEKIWASQHILEQVWINPDYGVPSAIPKDVFWKIARKYNITEFGDDIPLAKYSCWVTNGTYAINHKQPVPLEVTLAVVELISHAINHLTPKQLKYFKKHYKWNLANPILGLFKVDRMLRSPW